MILRQFEKKKKKKKKKKKDNMFHFTCFNVEDPNDPSVGLVNGQLSIPGILLRREVFDPVVVEVCCTVSSLIYHTGWLLAGITTHRGPNSQGRSKD